MNVGLAVTRIATRAPDSLALFDGPRTMDYRTLDERSNRLAQALSAALGVAPGERVALLVHNRMEVVEVLTGCAKAGAVYVGLNFRMTEGELQSVFDNAGPRVLITEPEFEALAHALADARGIPVRVLDAGGSYEAMLAQAADTLPDAAHRVFPSISYSRQATVPCCRAAAWSNRMPLGKPVVPLV